MVCRCARDRVVAKGGRIRDGFVHDRDQLGEKADETVHGKLDLVDYHAQRFGQRAGLRALVIGRAPRVPDAKRMHGLRVVSLREHGDRT